MLFFAQPNSLRMNIQQPSLRVAAARKNQGLSCAPAKQTSVSGRENGNDGVPDIIAEVTCIQVFKAFRTSAIYRLPSGHGQMSDIK